MKKILALLVVVVVVSFGGYQLYYRYAPSIPDDISEDARNTRDDESATRLFASDKYGFALEYPRDLATSSFQEIEETMTYLFEGTDAKSGFQIFVSPFDEEGPVTKERIRQDLPDLEVENLLEVIVTKQKIHATVFDSKDQAGAPTKEVWLVQGGYLYQVTAPREYEKALIEMFASWDFQ
ncbi:MAG: hypothetical protein A3C84_01935 [Candidatus Ryanbacteria bacterium RIFCSPHIGHO2_02_FULL_48_12]|uniref:DUF4367 domain-containing protein n=1 Tax=Candidatus Ryanbacteria bacterium RIFCSPHIGHO2_01_FULL_48_27 TaxID=1802115 RepID=A0A1G2FZE7_9BACT|nr:MAG: hypothetical protein A2756_04065 [Candidatus Ryanbacteria bacterium RIFCSPHIGHO2_01_FULL_48_27]OGZ49346.1 MAG: hypothetical protein A3C84_01935 [Candidatus Ryanbacteria bacterium RIFCSPHIGHO2_02_FULL_48_12]